MIVMASQNNNESSSTSCWTAETADWYASNYGEYATNRLAVDYLIRQDIIPSQTNIVVDVGCGTGCALRNIAKVMDSNNDTRRMRLIGVEPTPRMFEIAQERAAKILDPRLEFQQAAAEAIPSEDSMADVVLVRT